MTANLENFQIKRLGKQDILIARKLIMLFQEVFELEITGTVQESYLSALLDNPFFMAYVILRENDIIGGLTAYELPMYHTQHPQIFLYDIAIKPAFQRQGLGKNLLSTLQEYGRQKGIQEIFVDASEEDTHAIDFYHTSGGKAEKVVQFTYFINT